MPIFWHNLPKFMWIWNFASIQSHLSVLSLTFRIFYFGSLLLSKFYKSLFILLAPLTKMSIEAFADYFCDIEKLNKKFFRVQRMHVKAAKIVVCNAPNLQPQFQMHPLGRDQPAKSNFDDTKVCRHFNFLTIAIFLPWNLAISEGFLVTLLL